MIDRSLGRLEDSILKTEKLLMKMVRKKELRLKSCSGSDDNTGTSTTTESDNDKNNFVGCDLGTSQPTNISWFIARNSAKRKSSKRNMVVSVVDEADDNSSVVSALSEPGEFVAKPDASSFLHQQEQGFPVFQQSLSVDRTWKQLQVLKGYSAQHLGEQIVSHLVMMDSSAQEDMKIASLEGTCTRFQEISRMLVDTVDVMVSLMGPDIDEFQDELQNLGLECRQQGIPMHLLGSAAGEAVRLVMREQHDHQQPQQQDKMSEEDVQAWKVVIDFVASKMMVAE